VKGREYHALDDGEESTNGIFSGRLTCIPQSCTLPAVTFDTGLSIRLKSIRHYGQEREAEGKRTKNLILIFNT
jgi:hypothetical protein